MTEKQFSKDLNRAVILMFAVGGALAGAFPKSRVASAFACGLFVCPGFFLGICSNMFGPDTKFLAHACMIGMLVGFISGAIKLPLPGSPGGLTGVATGAVSFAVVGGLWVLLAMVLSKTLRLRS